MTRFTPHNFAALAIVASQLLIAAAGLWHDHAHAGPVSSVAARSVAPHSGDPAPAPADSPAPADDHDDCLICRIVSSQRIGLIDRAAAPRLLPVRIAPDAPRALAHANPDHIPARSRAPPAFNRA